MGVVRLQEESHSLLDLRHAKIQLLCLFLDHGVILDLEAQKTRLDLAPWLRCWPPLFHLSREIS